MIAYEIRSTGDGTATTYLTNRGDESAGGLELVVTARQVESDVVADRATVTVGDVQPGRTTTPSVELTVPAEYNYYLDALLLRDGVIVGTATSSATLDPSRPVPENRTVDEVSFSAGEFSRETPDERNPERTPMATESSGPGMGVAAALLALVSAGLLRRRWDR